MEASSCIASPVSAYFGGHSVPGELCYIRPDVFVVAVGGKSLLHVCLRLGAWSKHFDRV